MLNQLVFPLRLIQLFSNPMLEVSLIQLNVEPILITQSQLLDMELKMELNTQL